MTVPASHSPNLGTIPWVLLAGDSCCANSISDSCNSCTPTYRCCRFFYPSSIWSLCQADCCVGLTRCGALTDIFSPSSSYVCSSFPTSPGTVCTSLLPVCIQPPHTDVASSSTPAQSGVCVAPTDVSLGKPDVVPQLTSSSLCPPMAVLAYRPVLARYHQVGTSQLLPVWTQPPGYFWQAAPVVPASDVTPVPPKPGVAASPRPAHYGVYHMSFPFGRPW